MRLSLGLSRCGVALCEVLGLFGFGVRVDEGLRVGARLLELCGLVLVVAKRVRCVGVGRDELGGRIYQLGWI